jgi:3-hydroxyisobutyrate dehydrogenase-like beta-hydroxyacid dehydrogenase
MMIIMAIEAMAEAAVLTEANGLPRADFFELVLGTLFGVAPTRATAPRSPQATTSPPGRGGRCRIGR